ncbi:MAG: hypothetical protein LBD42_01505 [Desulfovibrio sp.]|nr:hypothetical protein [Desulfovibrio sp.]
MTQIPEYYTALAEAVSPLSHSLAAGMLIRPVPIRAKRAEADENFEQEETESATALCLDLDRLLKETVPVMKEAMAALRTCPVDELEEIVDELASPALELVDMARRIWAAPLSREAEGARSLLATLAEAPVTQLLQWILEIMHTVIDPWSLTETPDDPDISFELLVPDAPVRDSLARWRRNNPGILPEEVLR